MRKRKRNLMRRFVVVTRVLTPFGPGFYIHPGVYERRFDERWLA